MKPSESRGYLLLEGGAEFGGQMALADQRAIDLAGGPDLNHLRAGANGERLLWSNGTRASLEEERADVSSGLHE
jgi:hypothetical protein